MCGSCNGITFPAYFLIQIPRVLPPIWLPLHQQLLLYKTLLHKSAHYLVPSKIWCCVYNWKLPLNLGPGESGSLDWFTANFLESRFTGLLLLAGAVYLALFALGASVAKDGFCKLDPVWRWYHLFITYYFCPAGKLLASLKQGNGAIGAVVPSAAWATFLPVFTSNLPYESIWHYCYPQTVLILASNVHQCVLIKSITESPIFPNSSWDG